ncbi:LytR/AlgR family response regulator transcription factor [Salinibacter grassmerensis]|uniref:LytR/AlgR family response regulator transcription factor n=1 Tax=Salinibacter grassmerensis TaxID=3040353 RepID=UPI0021E8B78D|nr:LytTR family DNA-binding domain-containing protein [Salinibacter grassmerensis]
MHVLIVEDEPMVARRLKRLTRLILGDNARIDHADRLTGAHERLFDEGIDILLLDLNLRGEDGFDLLRTSVSGRFHTIVVSAHTDRAIEAFELGVLDFVGKPFGRERLVEAFQRVRTPSERSHPSAKYLAVRKHGNTVLIDIDRVHYLEAAGAYTELILHDGTTELHDKSLGRLVTLLPEDFVRIHRSYVARLSTIAYLRAHEGSRYDVQLDDGTTLPTGRTRVQSLRDRLL